MYCAGQCLHSIGCVGGPCFRDTRGRRAPWPPLVAGKYILLAVQQPNEYLVGLKIKVDNVVDTAGSYKSIAKVHTVLGEYICVVDVWLAEKFNFGILFIDVIPNLSRKLPSFPHCRAKVAPQNYSDYVKLI